MLGGKNTTVASTNGWQKIGDPRSCHVRNKNYVIIFCIFCLAKLNFKMVVPIDRGHSIHTP